MELRIRSLTREDYKEVRRLYEQYKGEMEFPDFITNYLFSFAVCDHDGSIVTVAGIRTILELVAMTDKTRSPRIRRTALLDVLEASSFVADERGYDQIHAFIQDEKWKDQLIRTGYFKETKGDSLVREVTKDG